MDRREATNRPTAKCPDGRDHPWRADKGGWWLRIKCQNWKTLTVAQNGKGRDGGRDDALEALRLRSS